MLTHLLRRPGFFAPSLLLVVAASAMLSACATKAPPQLPPEPGPAVTTTAPLTSLRGPAPGTAADFIASMAGRDVIYFDTDQHAITGTDLAALQAQAQWLLHYPAKTATIEGHCDERGTREYNLALGQRRAIAARDVLVGMGVNSDRLTTVTYGKERPAALGSNEEAWAKNRRAVTITVD